jgi:hypothetical protein
VDLIAIELVKLFNEVVVTLGADSLQMRVSAKNGYYLILLCLMLFGGGGFVFFSSDRE